MGFASNTLGYSQMLLKRLYYCYSLFLVALALLLFRPKSTAKRQRQNHQACLFHLCYLGSWVGLNNFKWKWLQTSQEPGLECLLEVRKLWRIPTTFKAISKNCLEIRNGYWPQPCIISETAQDRAARKILVVACAATEQWWLFFLSCLQVLSLRAIRVSAISLHILGHVCITLQVLQLYKGRVVRGR